jgi:hypothetical protein
MAMDNDKIVKLFRDDDTPGLSEFSKARIVKAAVAEFELSKPQARKGFFVSYRAAGVLAAAALAAVLIMMFHPHGGGDAVVSTADRQKAVLAEFNAVFGARLQAVVNADGKTQVLLADKDAPQGQPVHIHLSGSGHDVDIVSFSGENLSLTLNGKQVNFEALVDGKGGVILAGEKVFWHDGKGDVGGDPELKVNAQALEM